MTKYRWAAALACAALLGTVIAGCGGGGGASVAVTVSPKTADLKPSETKKFTATVTGNAITTVNWTVEPAAGSGSIAADGTYTAPTTDGTYTVRATSTV